MSSVRERNIQIGVQSGESAVAATTIWRGNGSVDDTSNMVQRDDNVGLDMDIADGYFTNEAGVAKFASTPLDIRQLNYVLGAGVKGGVTPVADGAGSGYVRTYPLPVSGGGDAENLDPLTIEDVNGVADKTKQLSYAFVKDWAIDGGGGKEWMLSSVNWFGRRVANITKTAALSIPTKSPTMFNVATMALDAVGGSFGATAITGHFLKAAIKFVSGYQPVESGHGQLYFDFVEYVKAVMTLDIVFRLDAFVETQYTNWKANTPLLMQLKLEGKDLATSGTYSKETIIFNLPVLLTKVSEPSEDQGSSIRSGSFAVGYDGTAATAGEIITVCDLSTLP